MPLPERAAVLCSQRDQRRYSARTGRHAVKARRQGTGRCAERTQPGKRSASSRDPPGLDSSFSPPPSSFPSSAAPCSLKTEESNQHSALGSQPEEDAPLPRPADCRPLIAEGLDCETNPPPRRRTPVPPSPPRPVSAPLRFQFAPAPRPLPPRLADSRPLIAERSHCQTNPTPPAETVSEPAQRLPA